MKYAIKSVLAAVGLLAMAGNAVAGNGHSYNGSYCDNWTAGESEHFLKSMAGIVNLSNRSHGISCPILVDEVGTTTGTSSVWVHFTANGDVGCVLYSLNGNGTIRQSTLNFRTNTGWVNMPNITSDSSWGSYTMYCWLPPYGTLNTIRIIEKN